MKTPNRRIREDVTIRRKVKVMNAQQTYPNLSRYFQSRIRRACVGGPRRVLHGPQWIHYCGININYNRCSRGDIEFLFVEKWQAALSSMSVHQRTQMLKWMKAVRAGDANAQKLATDIESGRITAREFNNAVLALQ